MGIWKYYRLDFNSTGAWVAPTSSFEYDPTYEENSTVANLRHWRPRARVDAPIIVEDTETPLFVQIDSASTFVFNNGSTNFSVYIAQCPVPHLAEDMNFGSSNTLGGMPDSSTAGAITGWQTVTDAVRRSASVTNPPPAFKVRLKDVDSTNAKFHVFLGFRYKP